MGIRRVFGIGSWRWKGEGKRCCYCLIGKHLTSYSSDTRSTEYQQDEAQTDSLVRSRTRIRWKGRYDVHREAETSHFRCHGTPRTPLLDPSPAELGQDHSLPVIWCKCFQDPPCSWCRFSCQRRLDRGCATGCWTGRSLSWFDRRGHHPTVGFRAGQGLQQQKSGSTPQSETERPLDSGVCAAELRSWCGFGDGC